jgi:methionine-rich copper-binding protein CopC
MAYGLLGLALSSPVLAAAPAATSDPAPNATVQAPLYMIHVFFPAPVDMKTAKLTVTDKTGKAVDVGEAMPMGTDGKTVMAMPKEPLPAGSYDVKWQAAGTDGKELKGAFSFTAK